ncbi:hypothetical protein WJX75_006311 [Coccomyxa subellipsoidea]|uniref:N-acetyltransferase domain-containing protein n=1 Tax=Coccomyxa subellipsoidea TaxID=248742 RepID=A0ABR2YF51_9CHLO
MQSLTARSPISGLWSAPLRHTAHTWVLCELATDLSFRVATPSDASAIRSLILKESMNPLGLVPERFTVAVSADGTLLGFGQLEQKDSYVELRSMIVEPSVRAGSSDVLLTTIGSRMRFYQNEGFHRLSLKEVPRSLLFEVLAGTVVARIAAGDELVVMKRTS